MHRILPLVFFLYSINGSAQTTFDRVINIPVTEGANSLSLAWAGGINFPLISPIDFDSDGLQDIFLYDHLNNRIVTLRNNGNTTADLAWDYAPEYATQFPPVKEWVFLYDYNCDGKADFFTLSSAFQCTGIALYKNTSVGTTLSWTLVDSCMKKTFLAFPPDPIFASSISLPHFTDVDSDGDMDILGYNTIPDGRVLYYKNISSTCDSLRFILESLCWGNFQLQVGGNNSVSCFHCPCRGSGSIHNESEDSFRSYSQSIAARRDDTITCLFAYDFDGDSNKELLIGDVTSTNTLFIHNGGTDMDAQDTIYPVNDVPAVFSGFHFHSMIDTDNDGLKDLIISPYDNENKKGMWLYKNSGTVTTPVLNFQSNNFLQGEMIDVGEEACPVLFDYDQDNLMDLVISKAIFDTVTGAFKTGLFLYKNTGTATNPAFDFVTDDFATLNTTAAFLSPAYPAFGDLDNDGDKDMLVGREDGFLYYYQNVAPSGSPADFPTVVANYMGIDVGKYATPQLYDLNRDGLLDVVCGIQRGSIQFFKNIGTTTSAMFSNIATSTTLGCITLQASGTTDGFTVPFFYDSLGTTKLLVAWENGNINQYDNIDGNLAGCFNLVGMVYSKPESSRIKFNLTVNGGDLNGDTLIDIVIGQSTGGVEVRYQHNPNIGIDELEALIPSFELFPNPANEKLFIRIHRAEKHTFLRIYNSIGGLVSEKKVSQQNFELSTGVLPAGVYFVQLTSGSHASGKKFVVKH